MMLSKVYCASTIGVDARLIDVEVNISGGLPKYFLVGLPDRAVSESKDRIIAAMKNAGFDIPLGRITVNLAPADLPKEGSAFDLPIAIGRSNALPSLGRSAGARFTVILPRGITVNLAPADLPKEGSAFDLP